MKTVDQQSLFLLHLAQKASRDGVYGKTERLYWRPSMNGRKYAAMSDAQRPNSGIRKNLLAVGGAGLRVAVNLVPVAGGAFSAALTEFGNFRTDRRLSRIEEMARELSLKLKSTTPNFDPSQVTEEGVRLWDEVCIRAEREHRERRRKEFGRLLASCWAAGDASFDEQMAFIKAVGELTELQIGALKYLETQREAWVKFDDLLAAVRGTEVTEDWRRAVFLPAITELAVIYGFVCRHRNPDIAKGTAILGPIDIDYLACGMGHQISPLGVKFLSYLRE